MRRPPTDLVNAMQPFRAVVLRKRPEVWDESSNMDRGAAGYVAQRIGKPAGQDEGTVALLRRLTAAVGAEPNPKGRSPLPCVPSRHGTSWRAGGELARRLGGRARKGRDRCEAMTIRPRARRATEAGVETNNVATPIAAREAFPVAWRTGRMVGRGTMSGKEFDALLKELGWGRVETAHIDLRGSPRAPAR